MHGKQAAEFHPKLENLDEVIAANDLEHFKMLLGQTQLGNNMDLSYQLHHSTGKITLFVVWLTPC